MDVHHHYKALSLCKLVSCARSVWLLVFASLVLSAFLTEVDVDISVTETGSGVVKVTVTLDPEAASGVLDLDPETGGLSLSDLAFAGWDVQLQTRGDDSVEIEAVKEFGTTSQFGQIMDELSSDTGVMRNFTLRTDQSFGRIDYALAGELDTTGGLDSFADNELIDQLGRSLTDIADSYGASRQNVVLRLQVSLPGEMQQSDLAGEVVESGPNPVVIRWNRSLGDSDRTTVMLKTTRRATRAQVLRGVAVVAVALAGLIVFARLLRWFSNQRKEVRPSRQPRPADALGRTPEELEAEDRRRQDRSEQQQTSHQVSQRYKVVTLDGMGVLYREANEAANLLVPFAREKGSMMPAVEIETRARQVSLGRLTSADFWSTIGVPGDHNQLDTEYLSRHQLMPGVVKYMRSLRDQGIRIACITNDGAQWAAMLRVSHSLENLIDQWVVSGSVGVRKPDRPIFEVLRRVIKEPANAVLLIDDDLDSLDVARGLGFGTGWFSIDGTREDARGHRIIRGFSGQDFLQGDSGGRNL